MRDACEALAGATRGTELVTVVIPARNEEAHIRVCLNSVLAQNWPAMEVLVVDGDSDDRTRTVVEEIARSDDRVRLVPNPARIIPVAMNLGLAQASGRWLVRVDAHAELHPGYVRRAVELLETGEYGGVGGRKDGVASTPTGLAIAAAMSSRFGVGGSTYHFGTVPADAEHVPFGSYPVDLLRSVGGWDERLVVNQDFELDYRLRALGHRIRFDPGLRIDWQSRQTISDLFRQYRRYGRGKVTVALLHPASLRPRHLAAPALTAVLASAAVLAPRRPGLAAGLVTPYLAGLGLATARTSAVLEPAARRYLPAAFVAMHVGWGLGFWQGLLVRALRSGTPRRVF
jgi:succinoglycan biosynthesis protein ExoA